MTRIRAFTLVELLITLMLSSIVFVLVWGSYRYLTGYRSLIENSLINQIAVNELEQVLSKDLQTAIEMDIQGNQLRVYKQADTSKYHLSDSLTTLILKDGQRSFAASLEISEDNGFYIAAGTYQKEVQVDFGYTHGLK